MRLSISGLRCLSPLCLAAPALTVVVLLCAMPLVAQDAEREPPKRGSVTGVVVENKSDAPVRKAVVILHREQDFSVGTTTDAAGKFAFRDLEPGAYTVTVERDGYVTQPGNPPQVANVKAGETVTGLKLKVLRTGAISGRILDADGEPVAGVNIQVRPVRPRKGGPPGGSYATTNDRGEYRAYNIAPGEYRVSATYTPRTQLMRVRMQPAAGGDSRSTGEAYPPVYYPGTLDPRQATVVAVGEGADLQGFDMQLIRARGVRIRGRVTVPEGDSPPLFAIVRLTPAGKGGPDPFVTEQSTLIRDPRGEFELAHVLPGTYNMIANAGGLNDTARLTARRTIEIGETDVEGIHLTLSPRQTLHGGIIVPEGRKIPQGLIVALGSREPGDRQSGGVATVPADGAFTMKDVAPGEYDVIVGATGAGDDLYISAIRQGDTDALTEGVRIGDTSPAPLEIVLKANGGTAECTVTNEKGEPVPGANVLLVPDGPRQRQIALFGTCRTDAKGICTIKGITPGEYHAYGTFSDMEIDRQDPDALKPLEKFAKAVKFEEGTRQAVELKLAREE